MMPNSAKFYEDLSVALVITGTSFFIGTQSSTVGERASCNPIMRLFWWWLFFLLLYFGEVVDRSE